MVSTTDEVEKIGERVRRARLRLGMPQADLAAALHRTQGLVSKVERGLIEIDRVGLLNRVAAELRLHPNDLIGRPYTSSPAESRWQTAASSIVRELRRYDLTPVFDGAPRSSQALWGEMVHLHRLRDAAASTMILKILPDLLREARALAETSVLREREEGFALYTVMCKFAHTAAHALGHPELIAISCERAVWAAGLSADPVLPTVADWMRVWDMWATADWDDSLALSDKALLLLERDVDRGDPHGLRAWGSLQLRAAVAAARAGRPAEVADRLALASVAADRIDGASGPPLTDRHSLTFSRGNVFVHTVSSAVEMGDSARALALDAKAEPGLVSGLPNSRRSQHHLDLARAWLWQGDRAKATAELATAERIGPQLIRNHPIARATLRTLINAERVATQEQLRRMSDRFRLDA